MFLNANCTFEMIPPMIISKWSYNLKVIHYDERCMCTKFHAFNTSMVAFKKSKKDKKMRFGQSTAVSLELGDCMFSMLDHALGSLPANHSVILVIVCGSVHNEQGGIHNQAAMTCINITWPQT